MPLFAHLKIVGHSMEPTFKNHDSVIVVPFLFGIKPRLNDVIIFSKENKLIVKRIKDVQKDKFLTQGDNVLDSKEYGWINRKEILGKVIFKL